MINVLIGFIQKQFKKSIIILFGFGLIGLHAQESVNTAGIDLSGNGGSASSSIGQVVYQFYSETNISISEGVQQPFEISMSTLSIDDSDISNTIGYPNPTTDIFTLSIDQFETPNLSYELYSITGRLLMEGVITENLTNISFGNLTPSIYILNVFENNRKIKIFKITKN